MAIKYVLRNLPGVAALEARLQRIEAHPNPEWAPEVDGLQDAIDRLARSLFGTTEDEIGMWVDVDEDDSPYLAALAEFGWDLTDGSGKTLLAFYCLATPLAFATDGKAGRLPDAPPSDSEIAARSKDWEASLRREAGRFRAGR
jgi:hypothetical protein